ncbi:MAG: hypothetical protein AAF497_25310, partial [Planctomycetota bacterium]
MLAKNLSKVVLFLVAFGIGTSSVATCLGQESATAEKNVDWKKDPVCQSVFFAVLEGCYRDNISAETVDNLVGPHGSDKTLKQRMQRSFVLGCPLCEPTFHAFLAYQSHLAGNSTFALKSKEAPLDKDLAKRLLSEDVQVRLKALDIVVEKWVAK